MDRTVTANNWTTGTIPDHDSASEKPKKLFQPANKLMSSCELVQREGEREKERENGLGRKGSPIGPKKEKGLTEGGGTSKVPKRQEGVGAGANALIILSRQVLDLGDRILAWPGG